MRRGVRLAGRLQGEAIGELDRVVRGTSEGSPYIRLLLDLGPSSSRRAPDQERRKT